MFSLVSRFKRWLRRTLKIRSESRQKKSDRTSDRTLRILLLVLVSVLIGILYPGQTLYAPLDIPHKGEVAVEDIVATAPITILKTPEELAEEKYLVRFSVPYYVDLDTVVTNTVFENLATFFRVADSLSAQGTLNDGDADTVGISILKSRFPSLSENTIRKSLRRKDMAVVKANIEMVFRNEIYRVGVLPDQSALPEARGKSVIIRSADREQVYTRDKIPHIAIAIGRLLTALNKLGGAQSIDVEYHYLLGRAFIQPNLQVDANRYNALLQEELAAISPVKEVVQAGDITVRSGDRITDRQERILEEMARLALREKSGGWIVPLLPAVARVLLVLVCFAGLYLFLYHFRREIYYSLPRLFAILLVFGFQLVLIWLVAREETLSLYLYPVAMLPILVTILFDAEVGILSTLVLALLLGIMHRFSFTLCLMTVIVGIVGCFLSRRVRKRSQFLYIMFYTALCYAAVILLVENLRISQSSEIATDVVYGLVNGIATGLLVLGLLPFFESIFGFASDVTLLELSDPNHPLLRRLALEAPGTYHHSIIVSNLCEAGAKSIGANSLLARVGAYYHDIGKIEIPEYFVENQLGVKSKHDHLSPTMSALILSSHVKKGRQLGEEADIPDDVLNFIEEHHGTMVMTFFHQKAIQLGEDDVTEDKFRYPGPRPQTRETALSMLADGVEAASRTLDDPKPARIHHLIQRIINERFQSGELEDCPLTLRDLARIREAFAQVLIGAFHHRVVYPKREAEAR
jgi:cyclic-di-AMP phosphodiesterase PgpH